MDTSQETLRFMKNQEDCNNKTRDALVEIKTGMATLTTIVNKGFLSTHKKQDHTNGWIKVHDQEDRKTKERYKNTWENAYQMEKNILKRWYNNMVKVGFWAGIVILIVGFFYQ